MSNAITDFFTHIGKEFQRLISAFTHSTLVSAIESDASVAIKELEKLEPAALESAAKTVALAALPGLLTGNVGAAISAGIAAAIPAFEAAEAPILQTTKNTFVSSVVNTLSASTAVTAAASGTTTATAVASTATPATTTVSTNG